MILSGRKTFALGKILSIALVAIFKWLLRCLQATFLSVFTFLWLAQCDFAYTTK
jgi:hypothetical protein